MLKDMSDVNNKLKFTLIGTGTSSGVPTIGCKCLTCTSDDLRDVRLRCSLLIESETTTIVIDTSSDFRQQMLKNKVDSLDAVVFTHHHFDHIGGFDDIRAFNYTMKRSIPVYLTEKTFKELKRSFIYAFEEPEQIGGGVPLIDVNLINDSTEKITIGDIELIPLITYHGKLKVLGFRIGDFAYCTDTNHIPDSTLELMKGVKVLILDALRYEKHSTHFNIDEATETAQKINPTITYFTHIAHQIKHDECEKNLPENIKIAFDGLVIRM